MSKSSRHKEKYVNGIELSEANEGSAARTRPCSLEDIMIRRKNKKVNADANDRVGEPDDLSRRDIVENFRDYPEHDRGYRHSKESASVDSKKATEDTTKRSFRNEESTSVKELSSVKDGDKETRDSKTKFRDKLDSDTGRVKEHKSDKQIPHKSRNEEHLRDDIDKEKAKEGKKESQSHHRSRKEEHSKVDNEKGRVRERRDEKQSHHRSRNEKRPRDDNETRMEYTEKLVGKETVLDSEPVISERESKRKHGNRDEGKARLETDGSVAEKHDSGKGNPEPAERRDKRKGTSKSPYGRPVEKRRRSRSREYRARDRSISRSPKAHKRTYEGQEHGESSLHPSKDRRQISDDDRNRVSSNDGHVSNYIWRHGGRGNRLGGYSPRKRRSEAAIKTPSPSSRSPERKNAAWDLPPTGTGSIPAGVISDFQSLHQSITPTTLNVDGAVSGTLPSSVSKAKDDITDPIQLSEATRSLRRLYVENLPVSASEKSVIECLNDFLMSVSNHSHSIHPCISCNIDKEKGHALVEFLTTEDATRALFFDGKPFSNSVLKIRRPKAFVDSATGDTENSVPVVATISDIVRDSPDKIFIGGISKALSSDLLMEIVSAFGQLKAYHFEVNDDLKEPCAYLEYMDHDLTLKACAGLNGMKLGGQFLTVVQAVPDEINLDDEKAPFYGIPGQAKPLLSEPTKVLKLKNLLNPEESIPEMEETLEDIRIECARFGTVKSINLVKYEKTEEQEPPLEASGDFNNEEETHMMSSEDKLKMDSEELNDKDDEVFEQGSVFVEYLRSEASCAAAHCLHGRRYGDQIVSVSYISHHLYLLKFPK